MLAFNLRAQLAAAPAVAALVGTGVAVNSLPQDTPRPHIALVDSYVFDRGMAGNILGVQVTIAVQCWADDADTARDLADAVQPLLLGWRYILTERASGYDDEYGFNVVVLTLQHWGSAEDVPPANFPPGIAPILN